MKCNSQTGYIRTKRSLYMIEPLEGYDFTSNIEHPHIVYKANYDEYYKNGGKFCNVTQNFIKKIAKQVSARQRRTMPKATNSYTIELLVVLDKTLLDYHKDFDVENYMLTLFNMVRIVMSVANLFFLLFTLIILEQAAGLFQDSSLGVEMELVIVRIIRLEVEEDEVSIFYLS